MNLTKGDAQDMDASVYAEKLEQLLAQAKPIARDYYQLTGRPLGITGEIAEFEAARLLNLTLSQVRQSGYDAICADGTKVQIKGRVVFPGSKSSQRLGRIRLETEWDVVFLVLLNHEYEAQEIYEAQRPAVEVALSAPGSRSRNERGALSISKFKSIARLVWRKVE